MGTLICITYEDEYRASEIFPSLLRLQAGALINVDDMLVVTRDQSGTLRIQRLTPVPADTIDDTFWRTLLHALIVAPLTEGYEKDNDHPPSPLVARLGIATDFTAHVRHRLRPGTSAMLILMRRSLAAWTIPEVSRFGGTIAMSPLHIDSSTASLSDPQAG